MKASWVFQADRLLLALLLVAVLHMVNFPLFKRAGRELRSEAGVVDFIKDLGSKAVGVLGSDVAKTIKNSPASFLAGTADKDVDSHDNKKPSPEQVKKYIQKVVSEHERTRPSGKKITVTKLHTVPGPAGSDDAFYNKILAGIGAPVTPENRKFMYAWRVAEGGTAAFNPFNTTQGAPGATNYNTAGVKNYTSEEQGVAATVKTLLNGRYSEIVSALRAGGPGASVAAAQALARSPWGTGELVIRVLKGRGQRKPIYQLPEAEEDDETIHMNS